MNTVNGFRVVGKNGEDMSGNYMVLDLDKDPHARRAASAYMESCEYSNPGMFDLLWKRMARTVR